MHTRVTVVVSRVRCPYVVRNSGFWGTAGWNETKFYGKLPIHPIAILFFFSFFNLHFQTLQTDGRIKGCCSPSFHQIQPNLIENIHMHSRKIKTITFLFTCQTLSIGGTSKINYLSCIASIQKAMLVSFVLMSSRVSRSLGHLLWKVILVTKEWNYSIHSS